MKKLNSIQFLRGIAALGVVLFHSMAIESKYSGGDFLLPSFFKIGQFGVDLFFVISGFIMITITQMREKKENNRFEFLYKRFSRIYPTYWFYFFITYAVFLYNPLWVNASQGNQFNFFDSFFLLPSTILPLVMVGWSLTFEIYFYLIFSLFIKFKKSLLVFSLFSWISILILYALYGENTILNPTIKLILHPYAIEFILGAFAAIFLSKKIIQKVSLSLSMISIVLATTAFLFLYFNFSPYTKLIQSLICGILFSIIIISLVNIENKKEIRIPKFFIWLGDVSYTLYLSHILVLGVIGRIWSSKIFQMPANKIDNFIYIFIILIAVLTYSYFGNKLIEKPSYNYLIRKFNKKTAL